MTHTSLKEPDILNSTIDGFKVLEKIGQGRFCKVYKVQSPGLKNNFSALKVFHQGTPLYRQVAQSEAEILDQLDHPNIIKIQHANPASELPYMFVEFAPETLRNRMNKKPNPFYSYDTQNPAAVNYEPVLRFTSQVLDALTHAHSRGVVHRDIKPTNILVGRTGSAKLTDFNLGSKMTLEQAGLAEEIETSDIELSNVVALSKEKLSLQGGTEGYRAPEQIRGEKEIGPRTDIYQVGVVLYEILTGQLPQGKYKPVSQINPAVPKALDEIIGIALEPDQRDRYVKAEDMKKMLEKVLAGELVQGGKRFGFLGKSKASEIEEEKRRIKNAQENFEKGIRDTEDSAQRAKRDADYSERQALQWKEEEERRKKANEETARQAQEKKTKLEQIVSEFRANASGFIAYLSDEGLFEILPAKDAGQKKATKVIDVEVEPTAIKAFLASRDGTTFYVISQYHEKDPNDRHGPSIKKYKIASLEYDGKEVKTKNEGNVPSMHKAFISGNKLYIQTNDKKDWYACEPGKDLEKKTAIMMEFERIRESPDGKYKVIDAHENSNISRQYGFIKITSAKGEEIAELGAGSFPCWLASLPGQNEKAR